MKRRPHKLNNRDHRKILVVDGRVAFTGGINISETYSTGSARVRRDPSLEKEKKRKLGWRDTQVEVRGPVVAQFQRLFLDAWTRQDCPPVPDPATKQALMEAARRGVDVRLVLPGFSDFWAPVYAGRSHYADLLQAGVRIHEWHDALMHAKTAVIDSRWAAVGSTNLDWRSFVHNREWLARQWEYLL